MAENVYVGEKAFQITANIAQYLRVTIDTSKPTLVGTSVTVKSAGIADVTIGVTKRAGFVTTGPLGQTINSFVDVRLSSAQGTIVVTNNGDGTIALGGAIYSAASGKVSYTQGTGAILLGYNVGPASTANGDLVEMLPL